MPKRSPDVPPDRTKVHLTVVREDGEKVTFAIRRCTPLKKVFDAYHRHKRANPNTFRFLVDGKRASPADTMQTWDLKDGDEIEASLGQIGGGRG